MNQKHLIISWGELAIFRRRDFTLTFVDDQRSGVSNHLEFTLAAGLRQLPVTSPCTQACVYWWYRRLGLLYTGRVTLHTKKKTLMAYNFLPVRSKKLKKVPI